MYNTDSSEVEVASPGGWKARLTGADTKIILFALLLLCCVAAVGYMWDQDRKIDAEEYRIFKENHKITQALLGSVITNQNVIMDQLKQERRASSSEIQEMIYVLTLSQDKRERLNLQMPQSLREKVNGSRQP